MPEFVCPEELTRNEYLELLKHNDSYIFIKFGAEWCAPCNKIKDFVKEKCNELPNSVKCYDIDVDENFDVYAYMKSKKMVFAITEDCVPLMIFFSLVSSFSSMSRKMPLPKSGIRT